MTFSAFVKSVWQRTNRWLALLLPLVIAIVAWHSLPIVSAATFTAGNEAELVSAINGANAAGGGTHTISITADITLSSTLPVFDNTAAEAIIIEGNTHELIGDGAHTTLSIAKETAVEINAMTMTGGSGSSGPDGQSGGALFNQGHLVLRDSKITKNSAQSAGAGIFNYAQAGVTAETIILRTDLVSNKAGISGGAIFNLAHEGTANVSMQHANITDNEAASSGGGISHGATQNGAAKLSLFMVKMESNVAGLDGGGGLLVSSITGGTTLTNIKESYFSLNTTTEDGGGIAMNGESTGKDELNILSSTLAGNTADGSGGGLYIAAESGLINTTIKNSTLSQNEAGGAGGALFAAAESGIAHTDLHFTTVAFNKSASGAGISAKGANSYVSLAATLVSDNQGPDCATTGTTIGSRDFNLDGDGSCNLTKPADNPVGTADLQGLGVNAPGPWPTHALGGTSQARNRVTLGFARCGSDFVDDQRGVARPQYVKCDIGAFEVEATPPACIPPFTAGNETELNDAIYCVNNAGSGTHNIALTNDIVLTGPATPFNNSEATSISMTGAFIIDANNRGTVLSVAPETTVLMSSLIVTGGLGNSGHDTISAGGIHNLGHLSLLDVTLTKNKAVRGGGLLNGGVEGKTNATLEVMESQFLGNDAGLYGGGIFNEGANGTATTTVQDTIMTGNTAGLYGGAIGNSGANGLATLEVEASVLTGNKAEFGGGMFNNGDGGQANANITTTAISNNEAAKSGGAIFNNGNSGQATLHLSSSTLAQNTATVSGGALYNSGNAGGTADTRLLNMTLSGNSASQGGGIANVKSGGTAKLDISYATVADNQASKGSALYLEAGTSATVESSLLAGKGQTAVCNVGQNALSSGGYNLSTDDTCNLNQTGDLMNGDPALAPLALNAPGITQTQALMAGSEAIDRVTNGAAGCGGAVDEDQRGANRPSETGSSCDSGAYEFELVEPDEYRIYMPAVVASG